MLKEPADNTLLLSIPLLLIPFLYSSKLIDPVLGLHFIGLVIFLLILFIILLDKQRKQPELTSRFFFHNLPFIFYIIFFLISGISLFYTIDFSDGFYLWLRDGLMLLLLAGTILFFEKDNRFIFRLAILFSWLAIIAASVGAYQLLELYINGNITRSSIYLIKSSFAHKNLFAEILLLSFPFAVFGTLFFKQGRRLISILAATLSLIIIVILQTRAVWLAFAISGLCTLIFVLIMEKINSGYLIKQIEHKKILILLLSSLIVIAMGVALYIKLESFETLVEQGKSIFEKHHQSSSDRISMWKKSLLMVYEDPFTGKGYGSWKINVLKYGTTGMKSADNVTFFQRPHNDFLWIVSETGLIGFISYCIFFAGIYYAIFNIIRNVKDETEIIFSYLMCFALTAYLICACFSFPKERIEHGIVLTFILAPIFILFNNTKSRQEKKLRYSYFLYPGLLFLLLAGFVSISRLRSEVYMKKAMQERSKQNWKEVIRYIQKAQSPFYKLDPMSTPLTWYSGSAYFNLKQYDKAFTAFRDAWIVHPNHIHVLNNLATCYSIFGNDESAEQLYKQAISISNSFHDARLNLATIYYKQKKYSSAYETLAGISPDTANSRFKIILLGSMQMIISELMQKIQEKIVKNKLQGIYNSEEWLLQVHRKAIDNNRTVEKQLLLDAIYVLEVYDKEITGSEAEKLRSKYF